MTSKDILRLRLTHQHLAGPALTDPLALVRWMGCVQAQDFAGAKWGIGIRVPGTTEASVDALFQSGRLLRTHVLRPTWHFVLPEDIRWMLRLTAPRVRAFAKGMYRSLGIGERDLLRSKHVLTKALAANTLTRTEVGVALRQGGVNTDDIRLAFHLMDAELEGLICSGGRKGKQFTYTLLEERVPEGIALDHDAALAELARRYFNSRGPATLRDFAWWAGLSLTVAKKALESNGTAFRPLGSDLWGAEEAPMPIADKVCLLPAFDEYMVAYNDRSVMLDPVYFPTTGHGLRPAVLFRGRVVGTWKRGAEGVETELFGPMSESVMELVKAAVARFGRFIATPLVV